jgi:hypothetical protein
VEKIEKIAILVNELTEDDFKEATDIAEEQKNYIHPLKMATAKWQHELGEYNIKVINKLRELKTLIESGANITRKEVEQ